MTQFQQPNIGTSAIGKTARAQNDQESLKIFKDLIRSRFRQARSDGASGSDDDNEGRESDDLSEDDDESMESSQLSIDSEIVMNVDESNEAAQYQQPEEVEEE